MPESTKEAADYILPLYMNGLSGRMLIAPSVSKKKREMLLLYGHHAMLERWWPLVQNLRHYGNVTMPDLPGFGGMEGFDKIGSDINLDNYADYLAAFVKLRYKNKRLTLLGISYGFVIATRMLQRYPDMAKKVDLIVSFAGFMHKEDFLWRTQTRFIYGRVTRLFATRPLAFIIRYGFLNRPVIKGLTRALPRSKHRHLGISPETFEINMDFEVMIWHANDVRTHWLTTSQFFKLDNTKTHIALPVEHIVSKGEHYFNNTVVEQHMRGVFAHYRKFQSASLAHVPHITASTEEVGVMLPAGLKRILAKKV